MDKISALMDGELDERQARDQIARIRHDEELLYRWHAFHLVGDVMRGERALLHGFSPKLSARLAGEPTVLAPRRGAAKRVMTYMLSAAASLCAIALVGWLAFFDNPLTVQPELAKAPATPAPGAAASTQLVSVPSDGKMNEYLIAHQEYSPSTAIQGLAPYIRSVSSTRHAEGR